MKRYKHNNIDFPSIDGVSIQGDYVVFDDRFKDEDIESIRRKIETGFRKEADDELSVKNQVKAYQPTPAEREKIQSALKDSVDIDTFGFYTFIAAESVKDRQGDILTKSFLEWMGKAYAEGRVLADSHYMEYAIGHTYEATVTDHEVHPGEYQLEVKAYVPPAARTLSGAVAKEMLDAGIIRRASVSFAAPAKFLEADHAENKTGEPVWVFDAPATKNARAEVYELSIVGMGAQAGARIKGEKGGIAKNPTFDTVEVKQIEKKMEKVTIKALGRDIETDATLIPVLKELDDKFQSLTAELQKYQEREETEKTGLITELVNLKVQVMGVDQAKETEKAKKLTLDELKDEIEAVAKIKTGKQIDPGKEDEKDEEKKPSGNRYKDYLSDIA